MIDRSNWNCICRVLIFFVVCVLFVSDIAKARPPFSFIGNEERWKRYYQLMRENRLPLLENEEEVLQNTDRILKEEKSLFLACLYIAKAVGDYENGYLLYRNERIKEKLIELLKMRIQCALKKSIYESKKDIDPEVLKEFDDGGKAYIKAFNRQKANVWMLERSLKELIERDGDLCAECYVQDSKGEEKRAEYGEDEFLPGCYSWDIGVFYSVALSCFCGDVYDYLWAGSDEGSFPIYLKPDLSYLGETYAKGANFATIYARQFLEDIEKGFLCTYSICRREGELLLMREVLVVIEKMIKYNPEFVQQEGRRIKKVLMRYFNEMLEYRVSRKKELLSREKNEKEYYEWPGISDMYLEEFLRRDEILRIYEQIGDKEDIEDIKKLGEGIALDYPIRESMREVDERDKERYIQEVRALQERVKALVEKLTQQ